MEMTNEKHILNIWGRIINIHIAFTDGKPIDWAILKDGNQVCPRCSEPYPDPTHNSEYTCKRCRARFSFAGAMHPHPLGEARNEIIKVANEKGINLEFRTRWI